MDDFEGEDWGQVWVRRQVGQLVDIEQSFDRQRIAVFAEDSKFVYECFRGAGVGGHHHSASASAVEWEGLVEQVVDRLDGERLSYA
jgi:hypothetical protein